MQRTLEIAMQARRRRMLRRFVSLLRRTLTGGLLVALLAVGIDRLIGPGLAWWWLAVPPVLLGIGLAAWIAFRQRGTALLAAAEIDTNLRLKDRLSSALELGTQRPDDPFVIMTVEQAEQLAQKVRVTSALPIRVGNSWLLWTVLGSIVLAVGTFVPPLRLLHDAEAQAALIEQTAQRESAAADLQRAAEQLEQLRAQPDPDVQQEVREAEDLARQEKLRMLEELRQQLETGEANPDEARSKAAQSLQELAEEMERNAEDRRLDEAAMRELLSRLDQAQAGDSGGGPSEQAIEELREALRRHDLDSAIESLAEVEALREQLGPAEQKQLDQQLEQLSRELEQLAAEQEQRAAEEAARQREPLTNSGLDEQTARSLQEQTDQEAIQEQLQQQGFDEDAARRLSERIAEENRRREAEQRAAEQARELSESMNRPQEPPQSPQQRTDSQNQQQDGTGPQQPGSPQSQTPGQGQEQAPDPNKQPAKAPTTSPEGVQGSEQQQAKNPSEAEQTRQGQSEQGQQQQTGEGQQQDQQQGQDSSGQQTSPGERQQQTGESQQQDQQDGQQASEQGRQQGDQQQGEQSGQEEGAQPQDGQSQPGGDQGTSQSTPEGQQQSQPGEGQPQPTQDGQSGESPSSSAPQPGQEQQQPGAGAPPEQQPGTPQQAPGQQPGSQPGEPQQQPQPGAGSQQPRSDQGAGQQPGSGAPNIEQLRERLEQMKGQQRDAQQKQQDAEALRRQAQEMLEKMSLEEREELRQWAEQMARENPGDLPGFGEDDPLSGSRGPTQPFETDTVDLRNDDQAPPEEAPIAAEWMNPDAQPDRRAAPSRREMREALQEALRASEEGYEQRTIPRRYRNVEKYFREALKSIEERRTPAGDATETSGEEEPAPAAEDID